MHFHLAVFTSIAIGASQALAGRNFWITAGHINGIGGPVGETGNHWLITDNIDCGSLTNTHGWSSRSDVSGNKKGVRVKWHKDNACGDDFLGHQCPSEVELNIDQWHRSKLYSLARTLELPLTSFLAWYQDRGGDMVEQNGHSVAHCDIDMTHDFQCKVTGGTVRYQTLLHCQEH